jgi:hypothetical protein
MNNPFPVYPAPAFDNPHEWSDARICQEFDGDYDITLEDLARMTGKTIPQIKHILHNN